MGPFSVILCLHTEDIWIWTKFHLISRLHRSTEKYPVPSRYGVFHGSAILLASVSVKPILDESKMTTRVSLQVTMVNRGKGLTRCGVGTWSRVPTPRWRHGHGKDQMRGSCKVPGSSGIYQELPQWSAPPVILTQSSWQRDLQLRPHHNCVNSRMAALMSAASFLATLKCLCGINFIFMAKIDFCLHFTWGLFITHVTLRLPETWKPSGHSCGASWGPLMWLWCSFDLWSIKSAACSTYVARPVNNASKKPTWCRCCYLRIAL